jgi:GNAT superfamily N-acetyltransferase
MQEPVRPPSDHDASNGMRGVITPAGQGTSNSALIDREAVELDSSGEEDTNSEEMEEDDDSGGDSDFGESDEDRSELDEFAEFKWLEVMDGVVTCIERSSDGAAEKQVGYCQGKLIRRNQIRAVFYHEMEEPSRETSLLAFDLFDRYGRLRSEFKDHPIRKGSGVWSKELDTGDILLIEEIKIDKAYRRRGLGKKVVGAMLEKAREKTHQFFAIAWPTFLNEGDVRTETEALADPEDRGRVFRREQDMIIRFFRSLGFRRIGSTYWFGLACEGEHPSRLLAPDDDYDPPVPHTAVTSSILQPLQQSLMQSQDEEAIKALEQYLQHTPSTDPCWLATDKDGNTLLHIAALNFKVTSVNFIMEQDFGPQMLEMRNSEGDTPLEAVLTKLEAMRTRRVFNMLGDLTVPRSDKFEGHSDISVICLARLKGLSEITSLDRARLASGCTCGQCISGFLSPRMCFALLCQAEVHHDMLSDSVGQDSGSSFVDSNDYLLEYLPNRVRENLKTNKSMRQGFTNMCDHIATCLRAKVVPNEANVLDALQNASEWPPVTKNFLQRGGSVACVALMLFKEAMNQDELAGDGMHADVFEEDITKLPECRNDHEFGFVSGMCGYRRISQIRYVSMTGEPIDDS